MRILSNVKSTGIKIMAVLLLFTLTIFLPDVINQYYISGNELLVNNSFDNGFDSWDKSGDVTIVLSESTSVVRLESDDNQRIVAVKQTLKNIKRGQRVKLSGLMKIKAVGVGDKIWQAARIIFVAVDAEGRSMYNVPHALVMRNGTTDWEHYSKVFVAVSHAASYYVELQLVNVTGVVLVKNLSLYPVNETLSFRLFQIVSALLWLMITVWILAPYWRTIFSSKGNILILLMLLAALFASLVSTDIKHSFIELLKHFLPWIEDEAVIFRVGHFLAYSLISVAVFIKAQASRTTMMCFGLLIIFSMATEVLQYLVDGRTPRVSDFIVDVSGVITGFLISYIMFFLIQTFLKSEVR